MIDSATHRAFSQALAHRPIPKIIEPNNACNRIFNATNISVMNINVLVAFALLSSISLVSNAQESLNYQEPPQEITELVKVDRAPSVVMDSKKEVLVFLYSNMYKTIGELSEPEMKLAGVRINPKTNSASGVKYNTKISIQPSRSSEPVFVKGLPA